MSNTQKQKDNIFEMSVKVKKLLFLSPASPSSDTAATATPTATSGSRSVKLPKIDIPTFDGGLLHRQTFWDQFRISIDQHSDITNTEKLVYLRHSLKDGSAKNVIEGLSHSGDQYEEAIDTLKARYDRPRIIHHTHALLELKLDRGTMFEWQKASQDAKKFKYPTMMTCWNSSTFVRKPLKPVRASQRSLTSQGRPIPDQPPPLPLVSRKPPPTALSAKHSNIHCTLNSSYSHMTRCCLPFA